MHLQFESPYTELLKTGCFFPGFPLKSQVAHIDFKSSREDSETCTKDYKLTGRLGAGVVLFWCVEHRECIGFQVLESAESCEIVYNTLSTRFETMPEIFIYDNACNLFEVRYVTYRSIVTIVTQNYLPKRVSFVTEYTSRVTRIAQDLLTVYRTRQCKDCLRLFTNRRTKYWISLSKPLPLCDGMYFRQF